MDDWWKDYGTLYKWDLRSKCLLKIFTHDYVHDFIKILICSTNYLYDEYYYYKSILEFGGSFWKRKDRTKPLTCYQPIVHVLVSFKQRKKKKVYLRIHLSLRLVEFVFKFTFSAPLRFLDTRLSIFLSFYHRVLDLIRSSLVDFIFI